MDNLSTAVAVLIALSIAAERLVDIVKGWIPYLNKKFEATPKKSPQTKKEYFESEGVRRALIQLMAVGAGIITALLARPAITGILPSWNSTADFLALGLLTSGGSGFWNSIQNSVFQMKTNKSGAAKADTDSGFRA
jgi:hypothetical protein